MNWIDLRAELLFWSSHRWVFVFMACSIAAISFWFREKYRVPYALMEIAVGMAVAGSVSPLFIAGFPSDFSGEFERSRIEVNRVQVVGAIYFIVRGVDNLDKGLTERLGWQDISRRLWSPQR